MSTKDTLTAGLNEAVAKYNALNLDNYVKAAQESVAANRQAETDYINSTYDTLNSNTQAQYDKALTDAKASYDSEYQKNAVQKIINEKKIAETNANLGLTDSGLNRTQQTAAQLSYANQKGKIDLARQNALDNLTLNLNAALAESDAGRSSTLLTANEKWDNQAYSLGQTNYNNDLTAYNSQINSYAEQLSGIEQAEIEAAAEVQKAAISASAKQLSEKINILNSKNSTLGNLQGSFASNGITSIHNANGSTTYTDTITGYSVTMDKGINPFTGQNNLTENTVTARSAQKYGTFSNGYQPKGIINVGELRAEDKESDFMVNGRHVTIWQAYDNKGDALGTFWAWDGCNNEYFEVIKQGNSWGLKKE